MSGLKKFEIKRLVFLLLVVVVWITLAFTHKPHREVTYTEIVEGTFK